jgi:hypothetical protein
MYYFVMIDDADLSGRLLFFLYYFPAVSRAVLAWPHANLPDKVLQGFTGCPTSEVMVPNSDGKMLILTVIADRTQSKNEMLA